MIRNFIYLFIFPSLSNDGKRAGNRGEGEDERGEDSLD